MLRNEDQSHHSRAPRIGEPENTYPQELKVTLKGLFCNAGDRSAGMTPV
jgi:hypothetical protein